MEQKELFRGHYLLCVLTIMATVLHHQTFPQATEAKSGDIPSTSYMSVYHNYFICSSVIGHLGLHISFWISLFVFFG